MDIRRKLLWVDGLAALLAGGVVLMTSGWLSQWYRLPQQLLLVIGMVNLMYASYSISLAARSVRPIPLILLLVLANLAWAMVCLILTFNHHETATLYGLAHLVGEALFVSCLAALEWRWRELLRTA